MSKVNLKRKFTDEIEQRAFELWRANRRSAYLTRTLLATEIGHGKPSPHWNTIEYWRRTQGWDKRAGDLDVSVEQFTTFKRTIWKDYLHAPHLELIDTALTDVAQAVENRDMNGLRRLMIFMPPRHGKSLTVARLFPAWFLGRNPDKRVILTAYAGHLVEIHSRFTRNLIRSPQYRDVFPEIKIARDSSSRASWDIAGRSGGVEAVGMYGGILGKGAHVLVIDDPVQSRLRADSKKYRDGQWETYQSDLYSRLEPEGAIVLIMTRWHVDDLAGRLLKQNPDGWTVIRLPAIAEEVVSGQLSVVRDEKREMRDEKGLTSPPTPLHRRGEPIAKLVGEGGDWLGRKVGEALWAERYSVEALREIQRDVGAVAWASLYQQRPTPREGSLITLGWVEGGREAKAPHLKRVVVAIDPAASAGEGSAETGILVIGVDYQKPEHAYVLEDASLRGSPDTWARAALAAYERWKADSIVVEVNQGGNMAASTLKTINRNVKIREVRASRGKAIRAEPVAALYEQGRVHHVGIFPALEDQMTQWRPGDASPDRLDALVWGLTDLVIEPKGVGLR